MDTLENKQDTTEEKQTAPQPADTNSPKEEKPSLNWGLIIGAVVILALLVVGIVFLFKQGPETTGQIRDVFIIFFALESLGIGRSTGCFD